MIWSGSILSNLIVNKAETRFSPWQRVLIHDDHDQALANVEGFRMPFPPNIHPMHVVAPRSRLKYPRAIHAGPGWSLGIGLWDGNRALLIRWNDDPDKPLGNPVARGRPTWFVLPKLFHNAALQEAANANAVKAKKAHEWLDNIGVDEWQYEPGEFSEAQKGSGKLPSI